MYESGTILLGSCAVAVITLCVKVLVIHRGVYPWLSHRVIGKVQVRFSTGLIFAVYDLEGASYPRKIRMNAQMHTSVDKRPGLRIADSRYRTPGIRLGVQGRRGGLDIRPLLAVL